MQVFEEAIISHLDHSICKLNSLGTILTQLTTMEDQKPDLESLADMGRLIRQEAQMALEMLSEGTELHESFELVDTVGIATPLESSMGVIETSSDSGSQRIGFV